LKRQFEAESKKLQSEMAELSADDVPENLQARLLELMKEKQDLEADYHEILFSLGGEKLLTAEDLENLNRDAS
jgi:hypothetical protein